MKFIDAFSAMKSGAKVKLPSWAGYWEWDPEKILQGTENGVG